MLTLLVPLCGILVLLGAAGAWLAYDIVQNTSDRLLSGSLQEISETLVMQDGHLTLNLSPSALGMLENADRDNVYYNISYRGKFVTGYPELSVITKAGMRPDEVMFRNGRFRGAPIRIAMEAKLVPELTAPVVVQVAETITNRDNLANRMISVIVLGEVFLLIAIGVLVTFAVDWGLKPLSILREEVESRVGQAEVDFAPLPLSTTLDEVLPFVAAFNALLYRVEASFETLKQFTSDASHQLRAPLAVIRTHTDILKRHSTCKNRFSDSVFDIDHAVKSLQRLIVQLISLAKAEQTDSDVELEDCFDLVECSAATARNYVSRALAAKIDLSFETDRDSANVRGNAIFASEMISNLLDNAIRYGKRGGHVTLRVNSGHRLLEVEDNGPGITPEYRARVFERFYRMPNNTDQDGSGLGLSIVRALGRRMGATVSLRTPPNGTGLHVIVQFQQTRKTS